MTSRLAEARLAVALRPIQERALLGEVESLVRQHDRLPVPGGRSETLTSNPHYIARQRAMDRIDRARKAADEYIDGHRAAEQVENDIRAEALAVARRLAQMHLRIAELEPEIAIVKAHAASADGETKAVLNARASTLEGDLRSAVHNHAEGLEQLKRLVGHDDYRAILLAQV